MLVPFCINFGIENRTRSLLGDVLEASLARLGPSQGRLGASWGVLERLGGVWEPLGCILGRLGALSSPLGGSAGPSKHLKKVSSIWSTPQSPRGRGVPHRTGSILGGFWVHVGIILAPFLCPWVRSILEGFGATFQHIFL